MLWNIEPWETPTMLMLVGRIIAWGIIFYGIKTAVEWLAWQVPEDADITREVRDTTQEMVIPTPPAEVRRRPWWKYAGLLLNNLPGSLASGLAVSTGQWWLLLLTLLNGYWAGKEYSHQWALDQAQKWEDEHASEL